ncbi:MAG: HlyD family efflux transporter periplasmic adaptor subunit [Parvibaculaceae bacterium]
MKASAVVLDQAGRAEAGLGQASAVEGDGVKFAARPSGRMDAAGLQRLLKQQVEQATAEAAPASAGDRNAIKRKAAKTAAALLIAAIIGWQPVSSLLQASSVEAVVNARLVSLRSPIDGELIAPVGMPTVGSDLNGALSLIKVVNQRADKARVDDLRRQLGQTEDDQQALLVRIAATDEAIAGLKTQTETFLAGRIAQLEARKGELESQITMAEARQREADAMLERTRKLVATGTTSNATLEKAERDATVAVAAASEAAFRLKEVEVELSSARSGSFLGDSYNDRPSSAQRLDEMTQRASDLRAELSLRSAQASRLRQELAYETSRQQQLASANVSVPVSGRVWEVLAAPGESVSKGQDIMRLLDCSGALVTASVNERVYNSLHVGMPAKFQFRHDSTFHAGHIVNLTGIAGAPSNFAIQPSALAKEAYRVTVAVPALASESGCNVGRTGRVVFEEGESRSLFSSLADILHVASR